MVELFSSNALNQLFEVEEYGESGKLITTPFSYPDSDLIQISLFVVEGTLCLSDKGETVRLLQSYGLNVESLQSYELEDIKHDCVLKILKYENVEYSNGEIRFEAGIENDTGGILTDTSLATALFRLINAILEVTNYCLGRLAHSNSGTKV